MSEPGDTRRDLRYIRWLWRTTKEPFRRITEWAKKPRYKDKIHRFRSAQKWARIMQEQARSAKARAKFKEVRGDWKRKADWLEAHPPQPQSVNGLVWLDGKQVPAWIANHLKAARAQNLWNGYVISGYRTPAYSETLCYNICGAPSCPGLCAGRNTNHACPPDGVAEPYKGAVDLSDPAGFQVYCRRNGNPLIGNGERLPHDRPHFSRSGV
jgi:hypothetical protein